MNATKTKPPILKNNDQEDNIKSPKHDAEKIIKQYVLANTPPLEHLDRIVVKHVYDDKYRVNVWINLQNDSIVISRRIAKSYFVSYGDNSEDVIIINGW